MGDSDVQLQAQQRTRRFLRNRPGWRAVWMLGAVLIVLAYVWSVFSFGQSVNVSLPNIHGPIEGVRVVFVPEKVNPSDQSVAGKLLLFPATNLTDGDGRLRESVLVDVAPAVDGGTVTYRAGREPEPQSVVLAALGVVQQYPWDRYALSASVRATAVDQASRSRDVPSEATIYFRMPSWQMRDASASIREATWGQQVTATFVRAGSTRSVAVVLLTLMVVLAAIAVGLVVTTAKGRRDWEFVHATWMTTMIFALMPLRSSFPGDPPLGVWIDVLVFFWVEVVLMVCVAITAFALVLRSNDPPVRMTIVAEPTIDEDADVPGLVGEARGSGD